MDEFAQTIMDTLAFLGFFAPNSFPTLVETPRLSDDGKT